MKLNNTIKIKSKLSAILIVLSFMVLIGGSVAISYAYLKKQATGSGSLSIGRIEISSGVSDGETLGLNGATAGAKVNKKRISVSNTNASSPIFIRAKISWFLSDSLSAEQRDLMSPIMYDLRHNSLYNLYNTNQNGATWSEMRGNYTYLVNYDNTNTLFTVNDINEYILTDEINLAPTIKKLYNDMHVSIPINISVEFQAISGSDNLGNLDEMAFIFGESFEEVENESFYQPLHYLYNVVSSDNALGSVSLSDTEIITSASYAVDSVVNMYAFALEGYEFEGWVIQGTDVIVSTNRHFTVQCSQTYDTRYEARFVVSR